MVTTRLDGTAHDVVVVGGGPAGLAAAIVAADLGASVLVLEQRPLPADKACGEGLLPPAVRALERLGVLGELAPDACRPFAGIRFVQPDDASAVLPLPSGGLGVRRTALVEAMARRARSLGAVIADRTPVGGVERTAAGAVIHTARGDIHARLVVAADGLHSPIRRAARLNVTASERRRFAIRQHFAVRPWTDCVEVHVDDLGEAVMTPVGETAVNVNVVWDAATMEPPAFDTLGRRFPALHARLAEATEPDERLPVSRRMGVDHIHRVTGEEIAKHTGFSKTLILAPPGCERIRELTIVQVPGCLQPRHHRLHVLRLCGPPPQFFAQFRNGEGAGAQQARGIGQQRV